MENGMSHYAKIKPNGKVIAVLSAEPIDVNNGVLGDPHQFIQTSYNGKFRNKYAAVGDTYDRKLDMFIPPQPYPSWRLEEYIDGDVPRARWIPPHQRPTNAKINYIWNEEKKDWVKY